MRLPINGGLVFFLLFVFWDNELWLSWQCVRLRARFDGRLKKSETFARGPNPSSESTRVADCVFPVSFWRWEWITPCLNECIYCNPELLLLCVIPRGWRWDTYSTYSTCGLLHLLNACLTFKKKKKMDLLSLTRLWRWTESFLWFIGLSINLLGRVLSLEEDQSNTWHEAGLKVPVWANTWTENPSQFSWMSTGLCPVSLFHRSPWRYM